MERNEEEKITDKVVKFVANILNFGEIVKICCMKGSFTIKGSEIFTQKKLPLFPPQITPKYSNITPNMGLCNCPEYIANITPHLFTPCYILKWPNTSTAFAIS